MTTKGNPFTFLMRSCHHCYFIQSRQVCESYTDENSPTLTLVHDTVLLLNLSGLTPHTVTLSTAQIHHPSPP